MAKRKSAAAPATPMPPAPDGKSFHANSILTCDCGMDVAVSFGGWLNLDAHKKSKEHANALTRRPSLPAVKKLKNGDITAFFKAPKPYSAAPPPKLTGRAPPPLGAEPPRSSNLTHSPSNGSSSRDETKGVANCALVSQLRDAIAALPASVPAATCADALSKYAVPPMLHPSADKEELWMEINKMLDRDIGYGKQPEDLIPLMRTGELGLNGFTDFINACIVDIGLDEALFEMRVLRVITAIQLTPGFSASSRPSRESASTAAASCPGQVIDLTADDPPLAIDLTADYPSPARSSSAGPQVLEPPGAATVPISHPKPCLGTHVPLPDELSAGQCYEWGCETSGPGINAQWQGNVFMGKLYIQAKSCLGLDAVRSPCKDCEAVFPTPAVQNLIRRILHGVHENTTSAFLSWRNMHESNDRLRRENNSRKLNALTLARKLTRVVSKLDTHKRLVYAIAEANVPRVQVVVAVALRNNRGAAGVLKQIQRAQEQVYHPRSFTEADYSLSNLILRLGGDAALGVASRACGLPTRSTVHRHSKVPKLLISHGYPTLADVNTNIDAVFPVAVAPPAYGSKVGLVLMIDETKLEERLRWDPTTNAIVGTCREHSDHLDLVFRSMEQAHAVAQSLQAKKVHYATEMTVAALGLIVPNSREHVARPIQISGTCKRENAKDHATLIRTLVKSTSTHAKLQHARLLCISTDGEAKRGSALVPITLSHPLPQSSPIYLTLNRLSLFNLLCGDDDLTLDKDYKHVFKRFRGMLLRPQGVDVFGFVVTADMLKRHLLDQGLEPHHVQSLLDTEATPSEVSLASTRKHLLQNGLTASHIEALMNPNDKQDVVLAYSLLVAVMKLPTPDSAHHSERYSQVRLRLNFLGKLFGFLLKPYTMLSMSLSEQMQSLSSAMFMILAMYDAGRGGVMPAQLYADTAHMVKNAYFSVAKLQVDDPEGPFHLILLGDDRLEAGFGNMRCMQPSDSNADILQGATRFAAGMEVSIALSEHPEWDRTKRRQYLAPLDSQGDIVDRAVDHISPRSWTGDVHVKRVSLLTCWDAGRAAAELELSKLDVSSPFTRMKASGNIDILRPLGRWCFNDDLLDGEVDEAEEAEEPIGNTAERSAGGGGDMDLEDHAGAELAASLVEEQGPHAAHEPWVLDDGEKIFKASVCRLLSDPAQLAGGSSTDRKRRFAGYKKYDYGAPAAAELSAEADEEFLMVSDTASTLLRCRNIAFLAFILISSLKVNNRPTQSITRSSASSAQVGFQVLRLVPRDPTPENSHDWRCLAETIRFGATNTLLWTSALLVEPIEQRVLNPASGNEPALRTDFTTDELNTLTRLILESAESFPELELPNVEKVDRYPYHLNGKLCFSARKPDNSMVGADKLKCARCTSGKVKIDTPVALLTHNASHLLYDTTLQARAEYCGFCLSTSPDTCRFYLKRRGNDASNQQIDLENSKCPKLPDQISYGPASKSSKKTPGTNVPLNCPLCEDKAPAVWRYNLLRHLEQCHPYASVNDYHALWEISQKEKDGLSVVWERLGNARNTRKPPPLPLVLSEAHTSELALRPLATADIEVDGQHENGADATIHSPPLSDNELDPQPDPSVAPGPRHTSAYPAAFEPVCASPGTDAHDTAQSVLSAAANEPGTDSGIPSALASSSGPASPAPSPEQLSAPGKRKRRSRLQLLEATCNCGDEIVFQSNNMPVGIVECIAEGCETRFYHEICALWDLKAKAVPSRFICASCKAEGATRSKRQRK